jgi:hypothetical protein
VQWTERLAECEGFQWDAGNSTKIWDRHRVMPTECEGLGCRQQRKALGERRALLRARSDRERQTNARGIYNSRSLDPSNLGSRHEPQGKKNL